MRRTITEYREAFLVIPEEARRAAIGKDWENTNQLHWATGCERAKVPTPRNDPNRSCFCPLGLVLTAVDEWCPTTPGPISATQRIVQVEYEVANDHPTYPIVYDFMRDWDEGEMTVAEMEAIFS